MTGNAARSGGPARRRFAPEALLAPAVAVGLVVVVWAATTGPVGVMDESGRRLGPRGGLTASATASQSVGPTSSRTRTGLGEPGLDLSWLGALLGWALLVALAVGAVLVARALWAHRWRPPPRPVVVDFEVLPDEEVGGALAASLGRDLAAQLAAVEGGTVREGIVACWLRLEDAVTAAGVAPRPSETSAELTVRVLHHLDVDPRPVARLAALYREARFSEHELGEDARADARAALEQLRRDLDVRWAVR